MQEVIGSTPLFSTKPTNRWAFVLFYFMYYVYIIYSQKLDRYYIGYSENLAKRLLEHNSGASTYTSKAQDWELKYQIPFNSREEALREEKRIKGKKSRKYIEWLIAAG
jgi:putative endonuclease